MTPQEIQALNAAVLRGMQGTPIGNPYAYGASPYTASPAPSPESPDPRYAAALQTFEESNADLQAQREAAAALSKQAGRTREMIDAGNGQVVAGANFGTALSQGLDAWTAMKMGQKADKEARVLTASVKAKNEAAAGLAEDTVNRKIAADAAEIAREEAKDAAKIVREDEKQARADARAASRDANTLEVARIRAEAKGAEKPSAEQAKINLFREDPELALKIYGDKTKNSSGKSGGRYDAARARDTHIEATKRLRQLIDEDPEGEMFTYEQAALQGASELGQENTIFGKVMKATAKNRDPRAAELERIATQLSLEEIGKLAPASDKDLMFVRSTNPGAFDSRETAVQYIEAMERLNERYASPNGDKAAPEQGDVTQPLAIGSIVVRGDKKYRILGGDAKDPDVEEVP